MHRVASRPQRCRLCFVCRATGPDKSRGPSRGTTGPRTRDIRPGAGQWTNPGIPAGINRTHRARSSGPRCAWLQGGTRPPDGLAGRPKSSQIREHASLPVTSPPSSNRSGGPVPPRGIGLRPFPLWGTPFPGRRPPVITRSRAFLFFRAKNIFPLKIAHDAEFFASRKYLSGTRFAPTRRFSEEKRPAAVFFNPPDHRREVVTMLSTQKVTENYQIQPLIYLTGHNPIPISCGQGSGHPHPVVVDNVSGSCGNLMSPERFCRL